MNKLPNQEDMIVEMEKLTPVVLNNCRILSKHNRKDYYYRQIFELAEKEYFFETYNVILWAALNLKPKIILEIGTRNGGSITQLLSMYHNFNDIEVYSFDLWLEIGGPRAVRKNLERMNIPSKVVTFMSGDSRKTIPDFKAHHPLKKFDYILVDGGHERDIARVDLNNVADMLAPGGILIFDDIGPESYKLLDVWQEFQGKYQDHFQWFEKQWRKGVAWAIRR
jgi:predicted O-methyltransferase YrrM